MDLTSFLHLELKPHPSARNRAVSKHPVIKGDIILDCAPLATALLPAAKGLRCDECHALDGQLRRCSGCASYYYCGPQCQALQWSRHHKHICKRINPFMASNAYQTLSEHERMDSLLLSHALATKDDTLEPILLSLLPGPAVHSAAPPYCGSADKNRADTFYARFGNNNFAMHSHLTTFGHGVFPVASRVFNHSCAPNAVAKYVITRGQPLRMQVVVLRDIPQGEEICLPYFDPALTQSRSNITKYTYGFTCTCSSCAYIRSVGSISEPPERPSEECKDVDDTLVSLVFPQFDLETFSLPDTALYDKRLPSCVFHESYLSSLSKAFSDASHEGQYVDALRDGITLLALYVVLYPPNYPQIGMHLLELAKTTWNATMQGDAQAQVSVATRFLELSKQVLSVLGEEGDVEYGPIQEMNVLSDLVCGSM